MARARADAGMDCLRDGLLCAAPPARVGRVENLLVMQTIARRSQISPYALDFTGKRIKHLRVGVGIRNRDPLGDLALTMPNDLHRMVNRHSVFTGDHSGFAR